ncbi:MAG: hypothetical protein IJO40_02030 [Thermoguttaceae bacterium]|nr:hypothetical protein [Thermoguttaceae bacterium]
MTRFFGRNVRIVGIADSGATVSTLETVERVEIGFGGATVSTLETAVDGATVSTVGTVLRITKAALGVNARSRARRARVERRGVKKASYSN